MKVRSPGYPGKTLAEIKAFVIPIYEKVGTSTYLKPKDFAKYSNVPARDIDTYATAAKQYGWMDYSHGKGYAPAEICKALRTPQVGEEEKIFLTAFTSPPLYKTLIGELNGKQVYSEGLKIYLIRDLDFTDSGAVIASAIFIENATSLGLIDSEGNFKTDAEIKIPADHVNSKKTKQPSDQKQKKTDVKSKPTPQVDHNNKINSEHSGRKKNIPIFVRGVELQFAVLDDMTQNDWDAIIKQIQNIKSFSK